MRTGLAARICALILAQMLAFAATGAAAAETETETALRRLDTGDDGRGWEAVGRLDIGGRGFCTGALIAPDLILTAAHCLYDKHSGARIDPAEIVFLAGWRNGRAEAQRRIRRAVVPADYRFDAAAGPERVRHDIALLETYHPIRNGRVIPFDTDARPRAGQQIGVVSYARGRAEAPALQEVCDVLAQQRGVLVMSCNVDFGASGAPVFSFADGEARIVSVVTAMAELDGQRVSLGADLQQPLADLRAALRAGAGFFQPPAPQMALPGQRRETGARFARPGKS